MQASGGVMIKGERLSSNHPAYWRCAERVPSAHDAQAEDATLT